MAQQVKVRACLQAWRLACSIRDPHVRKRQPTPWSCPLTSICVLKHTLTKIFELQNSNSQSMTTITQTMKQVYKRPMLLGAQDTIPILHDQLLRGITPLSLLYSSHLLHTHTEANSSSHTADPEIAEQNKHHSSHFLCLVHMILSELYIQHLALMPLSEPVKLHQ